MAITVGCTTEPSELIITEDSPIELLHFRTLIQNGLKRLGIFTVGGLQLITEDQFLTIRWLGKVCLEEAKKALANNGFAFAESPGVTGETSIDVLNLDETTYNGLVEADVHTIDDLCQLARHQIYNLNGYDSYTASRLEEKLRFYGFELTPNQEPTEQEKDWFAPFKAT